jgi:hypothetical protein
LAQIGSARTHQRCPLLGVSRTNMLAASLSAYDPNPDQIPPVPGQEAQRDVGVIVFGIAPQSHVEQ